MPDPAINRRGSSRAHNLGLRAAAGVVLAIFLLPLFLPFFNLGSESSLPACCRRDGKHHCAMSVPLRQVLPGTSSGPVARTAIPACPYRSHLLMPVVSRVLFVPPLQGFSVPAISYAELNRKSVFLARFSEFSTELERGPPSLLA
jgi:hypothetical protein